MLRVIHLATAVAVAMVALATLAEADFCMWCDPVISQNFLLCVGGKIKNDPRFSASAEALDDMKSSMIAASKAMKKSSESTKMNMMNGAMAGELAELIKSQPSVGNLKETTSYLLGIVRDCYVQTSGQPHYSFMKDIGKTVNFMLNDDDSPPFDNSESQPVPLQSPAQTLAGPAVNSAQNILTPNNNAQQIPSDSNVFIPNQIYVPPQSGISADVSLTYPQTGLRYPAEFASGKGETAAFSLNYPSSNNNNGPFINTGPNNQMPSTQTNTGSRYDVFQQNKLPNAAPDQNKWSSFVPYIDAPQNNVANIGVGIISPNRLLPQNTAPISNAASSSAAQNIKAARPWTIFGANLPNIELNQFLPQTNQPVSNAAPGYNFDYRRNAQDFISQSPSSSAVTTFTSQDKGYPQYYSQNQLVQNFNANEGDQNGGYPFNNANNSPDQITDDASSDYEYQPEYNYYSYYPASRDTYDYTSNQPPQPGSQNLNWNYPPLQDVNDYPLPNNAYNPVNIVQSSSKTEPQQNYGDQTPRDIPQNSMSSTLTLVKSVNVQGIDSGGIEFLSDGSQPNNAAEATPKENGKNPVSQPESVPKLRKWTILPSEAKSGVQKSSSDENDDIAKAMRFAETVYVLCSQSRKFKSVFNKRISNNKAAFYTYKMIRGALKDCGYLEKAEEIAKSCSDTIKSLPQKCPFIRYGEAISKSLMDEFYTKGLLGQNPEKQAKSITTAFLARLKKKNSSGSEKLTNKSNRGTVASTSGDSSSNYPTDGGNDGSQSSGYEYYQDYPKATDGMRKENYGDYPYYDDSPEQGSGDKNSDNDDSTGNQDSAVIDDYYNNYDNYSNPTDFQYPIKTNQPKAIQTAQKIENPKEKSLEETVPNTGYNYQMYGDYPNSQKNNDQNQKSTGKIPSNNLKYDYNQNYNYDPNYDYYNQNNDYYYQYYGNYDNRNTKPNKQPIKPDDYSGQTTDYYNPRNENNSPQSMNPDYYKYSGPNKRQPQAQKSSVSASSLSVNQQRKEGNAKDGMKTENAKTESPTVNDYSDTTTEEYTDYSQTYPDYDITLKKNDIQPEKIEIPDSTGNEDGKKSYSETALLDPNDEKAERKNRLNILMKWALSSISDGKFNYKVYSNVISAIAKYLQSTHPEWGSQKCFITILIESLVACTQLLTRIPQEYLDKMSVPDYIDTADETMANWSTNSLKQESQDSVQPDQRNSAQNVQTYEEPQKNKWNNGYQMSQTNSPPLVLNNNAEQSGYGNSFVDSNLNVPLTNQGHWVANVPQTGGVQVAPSSQGYKDLPQQNNWNNKYQLNQGSLFVPRLNNMQQGYSNTFMDTNLNMQLPRQGSWIQSVPQSGEESLIAPSSQDSYKGLPQQNN